MVWLATPTMVPQAPISATQATAAGQLPTSPSRAVPSRPTAVAKRARARSEPGVWPARAIHTAASTAPAPAVAVRMPKPPAPRP